MFNIFKININNLSEENPSEEVQLEAVKQDGFYIQYIRSPSEKIQLAAVKRNPFSIQFIENPSEEMQLEAVKKDGLGRFMGRPVVYK
jgi:hypothetical protein